MKANRFLPLFRGFCSFLLVLAAWSAVTYSGLIQDFFLPTPSSVVHSFGRLFSEQHFLFDIGASMWRVFAGFVIAVALAIPCGLAISLNKRASGFIEPLLAFIRYIPTPALIPLFILWAGVGETEKILAIAQLIFFQLALTVANAVAFTPKEVIESARTLGATRYQIVRYVVIPWIRPRVYDDLRISIGWAWSALMAAEIVGASSGIGLIIIQAQRLLRTSNVMAAILTIGFIGLLTDIVMKRLYPVLFPWAPRLDPHA